MKISSTKAFTTSYRSLKLYANPILFGIRMLVLGFIIVALARPQSSLSSKEVYTEGVDIVLAMDVSGSMLSMDFNPDRLEAAKKVAQNFIDDRESDRIGLVIFSGESFTKCPITTDHRVLKGLLGEVKSGVLEDGTAIGLGLSTAVSRLKDSKSKSKVIILMTDGVNNRGEIAPIDAAKIAKTFGVRVYTIGIGTIGKAKSPVGLYPNGQYVYDYVDVEIDEAILKNISAMTDGRYFRATNNQKLANIYKEIDKLEKTKIEETVFNNKNEWFFPFVLIATALLFIELLLKYTYFRSLP